jgi:hypothetical protein
MSEQFMTHGSWGKSRAEDNDDLIRQEARELRVRVADLEAQRSRVRLAARDLLIAMTLGEAEGDTWDAAMRLRALVGDETPNQTEGEPDMTTLSPAALALDSHLMVAANPGGPRTVCACGEAFYSNVDFLNHVAQMVVDAAPRPAREQ